MSNTGTYIIKDGELIKVSDKAKVQSRVYWPKRSKRFQDGRVIEHLTHKPEFVSSPTEYRELLKRANAQEAG